MKTLYLETNIEGVFFFDELAPYRIGVLNSWGANIIRAVIGMRIASTAGFDASKPMLHPEAIDNLMQFIQEQSIERVLIANGTSEEVLDALLNQLGEDSIACIHESLDIDDTRRIRSFISADMLSIAKWLGIEPNEHYPYATTDEVFQVEEPVYKRYNLDPVAESIPYRPAVVVGSECMYRKPILANPIYRHINDLRQFTGCSFCFGLNSKRNLGNPVDLLIKRLKQVRAQLGPGFIEVHVSGAELMGHIDHAAQRMRENGIDDLSIMLSPRVDVVLGNRQRIERALDRLEGSNLRIEFYLIGIENFSSSELERLNKGLSPLQIVESIVLLRSLKERYKQNFDFERLHAHGFILFTPWTSIDDIETNLPYMEHYFVENLRRDPWLSKLRLYKELAITELAKRENLLVPRYSDPLFDTSTRTGYKNELPWKFKHKQTELVFKLTVHILGPNPNTLFFKLKNAASEPEPTRFRFKIFSAIVQAVKELGADTDIQTIEHRIEEIVTSNDKQKKNHLVATKGASPFKGVENFDPELDLIGTGNRILGKKEFLPQQDLPRVLGNLWERGLYVKTINTNLGTTLLASFDENTLTKAVELEKLAMNGNLEADVEIGKMLGYPSCCVESFVHSPHKGTDSLNLLRALLNTKTEPNHRLNVFSEFSLLPGYLPCSFDCEESLAWTNEVCSLLKSEGRNDIVRKWEDSTKHPLLVVLNEDLILPIWTKPNGNYMIIAPETSSVAEINGRDVYGWEWEQDDILKIRHQDGALRLVHRAFVLEWDKEFNLPWLELYYEQAIWNIRRSMRSVQDAPANDDVRYQTTTLVASLMPGIVPKKKLVANWKWNKTKWQDVGVVARFSDDSGGLVEFLFELVRRPEPKVGALYRMKHRTLHDPANTSKQLIEFVYTYMKSRRLLHE